MSKIKFSIIGCGAIARAHLDALTRNEGAEITVLVDKELLRAQKLAQKYQVPEIAGDYKKIFGKVDAAIVALPHHLHAPVSMDLLQHGIHVLVEKPMALKPTDCRAMIEAARSSGVRLAVGLARRFFLSSQFVKQLFDNHILGDIVSFDLQEGYIFNWPVHSDFTFKKESGGGVLSDTGVHVLDLLLWWLGDYEHVEYYDDACGGVEANCEIYIKLKNGSHGKIELSRMRDLRNTWIFKAERGSLEIETRFDSIVRLKMEDDLTLAGKVLENGLHGEKPEDIYHRQINDFIDAIQQSRPPFIPGEEGLRSVKIIEACYKIRQPLKLPWMDFQTEQPFTETINAKI